MFSSRVPVLLLGLCLAGLSIVKCRRDATHTVKAYCMRDPIQQRLTMTLTIDLETDDAGEWRALNSNGQVVGNCPIDPTSVVDLESVVNTIADTEISMGCGFDTTQNGQSITTSYIWKIRYREGPDGTGNTNLNIDAGKNKLYTIMCPADSPTNQVTATITVTNNNLDQTITPVTPVQRLEAVYDTTGTVIGTTAVPVGTLVRLRATFDFSALSSPKPTGGYARATIASSSSGFTTDVRTMLDGNGCTMNNIYSPNDNYKKKDGLSSADVHVLETGAFIAWRYETTDSVAFRSIIGYCFESNDQSCVDPCGAITGRRRRREVADGDEDDVTVTLRVYDPNEEKPSTGLYKDVIIGVCVGGGVVLILLIVATCCIVGRMKKRRERKRKVPPEGFENKVQIDY